MEDGRTGLEVEAGAGTSRLRGKGLLFLENWIGSIASSREEE